MSPSLMAKELSSREIKRKTRQIYRAIGNAPGRFRSLKMIRSMQFPYRAPTTPKGVTPLEDTPRLYGDYPTRWARTLPSRAIRTTTTELLARPVINFLASPKRTGVDRLDSLNKKQAVIFIANHHSHADTPLLMTSIPFEWRKRLIVGAAADYFFSSKVTGAISALFIGAIPVERSKVSRKSSDQIASLISKGWSFMVFPEGGRSPDGWGQPFRGGAAYLAIKCNTPVVPVHLGQTGAILRKGKLWPSRSKTTVTFGDPIWPAETEKSRAFSKRIEDAVAELADETKGDWWSAKKRHYDDSTPTLHGPDASQWRRSWGLAVNNRTDRSKKRAWPKF